MMFKATSHRQKSTSANYNIGYTSNVLNEKRPKDPQQFGNYHEYPYQSHKGNEFSHSFIIENLPVPLPLSGGVSIFTLK